MENNPEMWPIPRTELESQVKFAKTRPTLGDAQCIIDYLNFRFRYSNNREAFELIDSIPRHFKEDADREAEVRVQKYYDTVIKKTLGIPELSSIDEEQIISAIKQTEPLMKGHSSWCGIYIVLTSKCGWPKQFESFKNRVERLEKMGLRLSDKISFSYQGLQKGWNKDWPDNYDYWLTKVDGDATFEKHKCLADIFLRNLEVEMIKEHM